MGLFARIVDALRRSRKAQADAVIRRYSHLIMEVHAHERKHQLRPVEVGGPAVAPSTAAKVTLRPGAPLLQPVHCASGLRPSAPKRRPGSLFLSRKASRRTP